MNYKRIKPGIFRDVCALIKSSGEAIYRVELYNHVDSSTQKKILALIDFLGDTPPPITNTQKSKKLKGHDNLFELRVTGKTEVRLFYFYYDRKLIITHGFIKKSQATPAKEIHRAEILVSNFLKS